MLHITQRPRKTSYVIALSEGNQSSGVVTRIAGHNFFSHNDVFKKLFCYRGRFPVMESAFRPRRFITYVCDFYCTLNERVGAIFEKFLLGAPFSVEVDDILRRSLRCLYGDAHGHTPLFDGNMEKSFNGEKVLTGMRN